MNLLSRIITLLILVTAVQAHGSEYLCRHISVDDGLSQSNVTAIARDKRGFLWVGSRFGLNRYDFANVTNYYSDKSDTTSIPDNSIVALYVDSRDSIWVAGDKGVAYYSRHNNNFVRLSHEGKKLNARSFHDEGDGLLIGGGGALYYYDYTGGKVTKLLTKGGSKYFYTDIHYLKPGLYVLATRWDGLWLFDRLHATITPLPDCDDKRIMASMIDSGGRLWVSVYGEGVFCYERDGSRTHVLRSAANGLGSDIVRDIIEKDGEIWLATDGAGINIYNPQEARFSREDDGVLSCLGSVTQLFVDRHGNVFGGTVRDGAFSVRSVAIRTFQTSRNIPQRSAAVTSIVSDDSGKRIWVGTDGGGVLTHKEGSVVFTPLASTADTKVISITEYDSRTMIVSTFDKGIMLLDKNTGQTRQAPEPLRTLYDSNSKQGINMYFSGLSNGSLAVLTDRITVFNPADGTLREQVHTPNGGLVPFYNNRGLLIYRGPTFIGEYDILTGTSRILHSQKERITCAAFDGDHTVYISTDSGLASIDITDGTETGFSELHTGFVSTLAVEQGHLWLGCNNSLLMKDLTGGEIVRFGRYDGVEANEYMPMATLVTDGYLYIGGVNGLVRVDRKDIARFCTPGPQPVISVSDIEIDGESAYRAISDGLIKIDRTYRHLRLSIIADGANAMHRPHYRFTVSGGGHEQIIETFDNFINIGNLAYGETYNVSAEAIQPDGKAGIPQHLLKVAVIAPWYDNNWTWLAVLVIAGSSMLLFGQHRRRVNRRRLASQLDAVRNSSLEKEIAFLVNTNYALRTPLTMIYAPIKMLIERIGRGESVDLEIELQNIYRNTKRMRDVIDMAMELHNISSHPHETAQMRHDMRLSLQNAKAQHSA